MNAPVLPKNWKALALDALRVTVYAGLSALAQWVLKALANGGWAVGVIAVVATMLCTGTISTSGGGGSPSAVATPVVAGVPPGVPVLTVCPVGWTQTSGIDPQFVPPGGRPVTFFVCERQGTSVTIWGDGHYSGFTTTGRSLTDSEARDVLK